jgi:hypothetical protein
MGEMGARRAQESQCEESLLIFGIRSLSVTVIPESFTASMKSKALTDNELEPVQVRLPRIFPKRNQLLVKHP